MNAKIMLHIRYDFNISIIYDKINVDDNFDKLFEYILNNKK